MVRSRMACIASLVIGAWSFPVFAQSGAVQSGAAQSGAGQSGAAPAAGAEVAADGTDSAPVDPETEAARASFEAGLRLADAGQWDEASAHFRQALALRDAPAVRTNLAISLAEAGHHLEALGELDRVLAEPSLEPSVRREVETQRRALRNRVGRLRVDVQGAPSNAEVWVDEERWDEPGRGAFVEPGTFVVRLAAGDEALDERQTDVAAGADVNLVFALSADGPASEGADATPLVVGVVVGLALAVAGGVALTVALLPTDDSQRGDFDTPVLEID